MVLKSKVTGLGLVEVRESSMTGWYELVVNGSIKEQSKDLSFILRKFDAY